MNTVAGANLRMSRGLDRGKNFSPTLYRQRDFSQRGSRQYCWATRKRIM